MILYYITLYYIIYSIISFYFIYILIHKQINDCTILETIWTQRLQDKQRGSPANDLRQLCTRGARTSFTSFQGPKHMASRIDHSNGMEMKSTKFICILNHHPPGLIEDTPHFSGCCQRSRARYNTSLPTALAECIVPPGASTGGVGSNMGLEFDH